jgi:plasmid maintenance system antidote protein VapI
MSRNSYLADYVSPPGETLQDLLDEANISQSQFAEIIEWSEEKLTGIINGTISITPEIAGELEFIFEIPSSFWLQRETNYRENGAKQS